MTLLFGPLGGILPTTDILLDAPRSAVPVITVDPPTTDNHDLGLQPSGDCNFSSATTDGEDVLACAVEVVGGIAIDFSSATTDGADVAAGQIAVIVAASSATTDGSDVLAAAIDFSSATTGGAVDWSYGTHGGGGAGNGQPVQLHDWRSINELFKTDRTAAQQHAALMEDDEEVICAIMQAVLEEML